jgi:murein DD-endopeptidase MepM/ murein hydrolase activator NlpD
MTHGRAAFLSLLLAMLSVVCVMQALRAPPLPPLAELEAAPPPSVAVRPTPAAAGITNANVASADAMQSLMRRRLLIPVEGVSRSQLRDNFLETRGGTRRHEALDIMAPRGTPVLATDDGRIAKLSRHPLGGITIYEDDPQTKYAYYYAHLDHYAQGLHVDQAVRRGEVIGYVGSTGNASRSAPHLHFTILDLDANGHWWTKGSAVDPYPFLVDARP